MKKIISIVLAIAFVLNQVIHTCSGALRLRYSGDKSALRPAAAAVADAGGVKYQAVLASFPKETIIPVRKKAELAISMEEDVLKYAKEALVAAYLRRFGWHTSHVAGGILEIDERYIFKNPYLQMLKELAILEALKDTNFSLAKAAKKLGIPPHILGHFVNKIAGGKGSSTTEAKISFLKQEIRKSPSSRIRVRLSERCELLRYKDFEKAVLILCLKESGWRIEKAAELAGVSYLYAKRRFCHYGVNEAVIALRLLAALNKSGGFIPKAAKESGYPPGAFVHNAKDAGIDLSLEKLIVYRALRDTSGNRKWNYAAAARKLGCNIQTVIDKVRRYNLAPKTRLKISVKRLQEQHKELEEKCLSEVDEAIASTGVVVKKVKTSAISPDKMLRLWIGYLGGITEEALPYPTTMQEREAWFKINRLFNSNREDFASTNCLLLEFPLKLADIEGIRKLPRSITPDHTSKDIIERLIALSQKGGRIGLKEILVNALGDLYNLSIDELLEQKQKIKPEADPLQIKNWPKTDVFIKNTRSCLLFEQAA